MRNSGIMLHLDPNETLQINVSENKIITINTNKEEWYDRILYDFKNDRQLIAFKNQMIQAVDNYFRRKNEA